MWRPALQNAFQGHNSARGLGVLRGRVSLPPVIFDVNGMRRDRLRLAQVGGDEAAQVFA